MKRFTAILMSTLVFALMLAFTAFGGSGYVRSGSASSKSTLRGSKASCNQCHGSGKCRTCGRSGTR